MKWLIRTLTTIILFILVLLALVVSYGIVTDLPDIEGRGLIETLQSSFRTKKSNASYVLHLR